MILSNDIHNVLVHFDDGADPSHRGGSDGHRSAPMSSGMLARMRWYLEWTAEDCDSIQVLIPDHLNAPDETLIGSRKPGGVIRYRDEGDLQLPAPRRRSFTFIINGNQFPIVQWRRALASAERHNSDVVVFGPSGSHTGSDYPESVLVDGDGQVIRFKRHYADSPGFADRWSGDAAFLVVKSEHAQAVAAHIVVRGWGLDSIGALVRRFAVRWLSDSRVLSDDRLKIHDLIELSRERPFQRNGNGHVAGVQPSIRPEPRVPKPPSKNGSAERIVANGHGPLPDGRIADPSRSDGSRSGIDGSSGEYTLANDDLPEIQESRGYLFAKRTLDITASALAITLLFPMLILVSVLIKLTSRGPIIYAHTRQGLNGKVFPCLKFRSMRTGADAIQAQLRALNEVDGPQFKMARDPRVTPLGYWLRRTNIDELPQLFNVLVGQMSLVGPRPSPDEENQYCPAWRRARLSAKPGITGLWQVLRKRDGRTSDFQEWIYYDVEYARHRSLWLDLQILYYTPIALCCPRMVAPFAARLERSDICAHSDKMVYKTV